MFGAWNNIAKSAEGVVSRWAMKRVFKFLLKKKLGQFILGDIDLDQLDVQLTEGTLHLSDLALNVDYLNRKIGPATSLVIKEGSIGSLSVKMPWKGKGCQVEVDELELLLAPCSENYLSSVDETSSCNDDGNGYDYSYDSGKFSNETAGNSTNHDNVHEGVKTIAKMVKWFPT